MYRLVYFQLNKKGRKSWLSGLLFIFNRIKKGEGQGKEKCHSKSMMSKEANERLKRDTHHVPLRQDTEEKVRRMGLKAV